MLSRPSCVIFVLFTSPIWAQHSVPNRTEDTAIQLVKTVDVSSLDRGLPKVTLEFFLRYEGEGVPIQWRKGNCDRLKGNRSTERELTCVEAEIDLKSGRSATILVSVGTPNRRPVDIPTLCSVTVTEASGMVHPVRLSDLPMELHRPLKKTPGDLPIPAGRELLPLAVETHPNN